MDSNDPIPRKLEYLMELGVFKIAHSGRTLGDHLVGTHDWLVKWGCPVTWCDAGLYHSVYGTETFLKVTTENRDGVQKVIGMKAELLAHTFCESETPRVQFFLQNQSNWAFDQATTYALLAIHAANQLDQGLRTGVQQMLMTLPPKLAENIALSDVEQLGEWETRADRS